MKSALLTFAATIGALIFSGSFAYADLQHNQPTSADAFALCYRAVTGSSAPATPPSRARNAQSNRLRVLEGLNPTFRTWIENTFDGAIPSDEERLQSARAATARNLRSCMERYETDWTTSNSAGLVLQICENNFHGNQANRNACYSYALASIPFAKNGTSLSEGCGIENEARANCLLLRFQNLNRQTSGTGSRASRPSGGNQ